MRDALRFAACAAALTALLLPGGCRRKLYENPITRDTRLPDKVLFETAADDMEHGRYEKARLVLQALMNTYDTSEYLANAKFAIAESWYRQGGARGMAQAEAAFKDFIVFYKLTEQAAEAQMKICKMQFDQMEKSDRDPLHALRAQDECRQLLLDFPNSKYSVEARQHLRDVQEVLAGEEYGVQRQYAGRLSFKASVNRGQALVDQLPLHTNAANALWLLADGYQHLGDRFEDLQAAAYARIVSRYPLSAHARSAAVRLQAMGRPVPAVDPVAYALATYERENADRRGLVDRILGPFRSRPYLGAARSGEPSMESLHPAVPGSPLVPIDPDMSIDMTKKQPTAAPIQPDK